MSDRLLRLASALQHEYGIHAEAGEEVIEVSRPASTAATLYERVRTTLDYQEEHLLRRNAILRILKRYLGTDVSIEEIAESLLRELIWAKYLPNKEVPTSFVHELVPIFEKYEPLLRATDAMPNREAAFGWVLDVFSTEIEYAITPPLGDEALVSYMYEEMRERIEWDPHFNLSQEDRDLMLYIAIHSTLLKSNHATLRFRLLTLYYPDWPGACSQKRVKEISEGLATIMALIEKIITHPVTLKLSLMLRRKCGPFRTIRDVILDGPEEFVGILDHPDALDHHVSKVLTQRTQEFRKRLRRTVFRAVLFLFITKMCLALILEVPYDFLVARATTVLPLIINVSFPPLLLSFIGITVGIPEQKNKEDYRGAIRALMVGADHELLNIRMKRPSFTTWSKIFTALYAITFVFVFSLIATLLTQIGFNWLSIILFLFFLCLVTFFGIRIRGSTRDVVLSDAYSGIVGTIFDVFMLPIVRAGRWLSVKVSKINVFIYFFDFIIEAPLKIAIRFIESWIAFIREKKEEI
jgi:hypothetical protein